MTTDIRYATNDSDLRELNENVDSINTNNLKQVYIRTSEFEISSAITRPANVTPYVPNEIINGDGLTTLPVLDFSVLGDVAGRAIQINSISLISSNGGATIKLNPIVHLYNDATITGQVLSDATAFNPSYSETLFKKAVTFESLITIVVQGTNCYEILQSEILRNCILSPTSTLYVAIIAGNAYIPASAENISITVKGYLL